jgi:hypothetical protein
MHEKDVELPDGSSVKLLYSIDYRTARDKGLSLAWLQLRRFPFAKDYPHKESAYSSAVEKLADDFAEQLLARTDFQPDVVLLPPSESRLFAPYVEALKKLRPELEVCDLFAKGPGYSAGAGGQPFTKVVEQITLSQEPPETVRNAKRLLIPDDVYNTGNTTGAMLYHIKPHLQADAVVTIACPLLVEREEKSPDFDWQEAMKRIADADETTERVRIGVKEDIGDDLMTDGMRVKKSETDRSQPDTGAAGG